MNQNIKIYSIVAICLAMLPLFAYSQDDKMTKRSAASRAPFGVKQADMIDLLMPTIEGVGGTARELLQQQSVKPYMMPVRKMGNRSSEMSYMLASCLEYYTNLDKNYKMNLSPDYISLHIENNGKKPSFEEAFGFLAKQGTVNAAIIPYDAANLSDAAYSSQKFKITNFLHLFMEVTPARQRVYEVRKALMRGNPVMVELKANEEIKSVVGKMWEPSGAPTQNYPLLVVGYDEAQQAFEVLSCWGRNWGSNGYIWISYDNFGKYVSNGYVLVPEGL